MFKPAFGPDPYFTLLPDNLIICLARFRTTNNVLPVNRMRYDGIPRNERICVKCTMNDVADEFHYLFVCPHFNTIRKQCLSPYFLNRPNVVKYEHLMSSKNRKVLSKLKVFIVNISSELI